MSNQPKTQQPLTEEEILGNAVAYFTENPPSEEQVEDSDKASNFYSEQRREGFMLILNFATGGVGIALSLAGSNSGALLVIGLMMVVIAVFFRRLDARNRIQLKACEPILMCSPAHKFRLQLEAELTRAAKRHPFGFLTTYNQMSRALCMIYTMIGFAIVAYAIYTMI